MSVETLHNFSIASYVAAGVLFLIAIILFFLFRIPELFCDITGITAKKAIEEIRLKNSGKTRVPLGGVKESKNKRKKAYSMETISGKLHTPNDVNIGAALPKMTTTKLVVDRETTILENRNSETTVLAENFHPKNTAVCNTAHCDDALYGEATDKFTVVEELSYTSSSVIIE